jgi:archaemetzincin
MRAVRLVLVRAGDGGRGRPPDPRADLALLDEVAAELAGAFRISCRVQEAPLDAAAAFDAARGQYHSTRILEILGRVAPAASRREALQRDDAVLGITPLDLFVPVLTFVFGEAQLGGRCALVSTHRLRDEFYGLPENLDLLRERTVKEAFHELGHTMGLSHCDDWRCVMASAHAVERIDAKGFGFCARCREVVTAAVGGRTTDRAEGDFEPRR